MTGLPQPNVCLVPTAEVFQSPDDFAPLTSVGDFLGQFSADMATEKDLARDTGHPYLISLASVTPEASACIDQIIAALPTQDPSGRSLPASAELKILKNALEHADKNAPGTPDHGTLEKAELAQAYAALPDQNIFKTYEDFSIAADVFINVLMPAVTSGNPAPSDVSRFWGNINAYAKAWKENCAEQTELCMPQGPYGLPLEGFPTQNFQTDLLVRAQTGDLTPTEIAGFRTLLKTETLPFTPQEVNELATFLSRASGDDLRIFGALLQHNTQGNPDQINLNGLILTIRYGHLNAGEIFYLRQWLNEQKNSVQGQAQAVLNACENMGPFKSFCEFQNGNVLGAVLDPKGFALAIGTVAATMAIFNKVVKPKMFERLLRAKCGEDASMPEAWKDFQNFASQHLKDAAWVQRTLARVLKARLPLFYGLFVAHKNGLLPEFDSTTAQILQTVTEVLVVELMVDFFTMPSRQNFIQNYCPEPKVEPIPVPVKVPERVKNPASERQRYLSPYEEPLPPNMILAFKTVEELAPFFERIGGPLSDDAKRLLVLEVLRQQALDKMRPPTPAPEEAPPTGIRWKAGGKAIGYGVLTAGAAILTVISGIGTGAAAATPLDLGPTGEILLAGATAWSAGRTAAGATATYVFSREFVKSLWE